MPDVQGRCPACGAASLFLGEGGHVTCARTECPNPCAADELLHGDAAAPSRAGDVLAALGRRIPETLAKGISRDDYALAPASEPPVVATARIQMDVTTPTTANLPEFERAQEMARAEQAEATIRRVRDASTYIRATTRTWDPVADIIDAALDEDGDPVHARVALAVRTVLNQDLPGDMDGHVATAVLAVLRKEAPRES
ncbi:hypothetical protein [Streptomyces griseus]|uniref:hypothetical protein n=1 Tax=Streptomyces griseus TaxID=1911 RepID=UPI00379DC877